MSRMWAAVRVLAATVLLVLVVVGIPVLLVASVGNPWPGRSSLEMTDQSAILSGLLVALIWVVWARFVLLIVVETSQQVTWIREVRAANRDRAPRSRPVTVEPIAAPRGGLGVLAQRLVATVLVLVPLLTKTPRVGEAAPPLPVMAPADPTEAVPEGSAEPQTSPRPQSGRTGAHVEVTIGPNETLRSVARDHLGDPGRWREIFQLNVDRVQVDGRRLTSPSALHTGWQLRLPADAIVPAPSGTAAALPGQVGEYVVRPGDGPWHVAEALLSDGSRYPEVLAANVGEEVAPGIRWTADDDVIHPGWTFRWPVERVAGVGHTPETSSFVPGEVLTVRSGDTLWQLAEDQLARAGVAGHGETMDYLERVIAANHLVIEDPDLIHPGDQIRMPTIGAEPAGPVADRPPAVAPDGRDRDEDRSDHDANGRSDDRRPRNGTEPAPAHEPERSQPKKADTPSTTIPAPTATASSDPVVPSPEPPDADPAPPAQPSNAPVGLGIAALSAGVLAVLESHRRRRLRAAKVRDRITPPPAQELVDVERRLRKIEGVERSARLDVAVRAAASAMLRNHHRLVAAIVDPRGAVSIVLDGPVALPLPWTNHAGRGTHWELPPDIAIERLAAQARQVSAPCAALVPLGTTAAGAEVHVDLECLGTLAVDAEPEVADQIVAAIAAGTAGSPSAEAAHLIGVGVAPSAFLGHPNHHDAESVDEAVELAGALIGAPSPNESTFHLRARHTGGESWEPAVIFVGAAHAGERDDALAGARLAYVVAGAAGQGEACVTAGVDTWRLDPYGIELTPVGLTAEELLRIDELLDNERNPSACDAVCPDESSVVVGRPPSNGVDGAEGADDVDDVDEADAAGDVVELVEREPHWDVLVRVFGLVDVVDAAGTTAQFAKSKSLELFAWVATHRDRSTRQGARAALWDVDVRDATFANIVSEARRAAARLSTPPDGEEWLARTMNASLVLHPRVVTDAELITARLERARRQTHADAVASLRGAVEQIRGVPFAESGYLWPDAEGITSALVVLATSCCSELCELLLDDGDVEGVFWATGQGLKVLPGHEELIAYRMRAHALRGDRAAVRQEWEAYERVLLADPWSDGEPAPSLVRLRQTLTT